MLCNRQCTGCMMMEFKELVEMLEYGLGLNEKVVNGTGKYMVLMFELRFDYEMGDLSIDSELWILTCEGLREIL